MQLLRKRVSRRCSRVHNKSYPSLGLCVPQAILEDSTFAIAIFNVTLYYSTTLASVYASSARQVVCIICRILALYLENAAETILEGLKSNIFLGVFPQTSLVRALRVHLCAAENPPCEFLPTPLIIAYVHSLTTSATLRTNSLSFQSCNLFCRHVYQFMYKIFLYL